MCKNTIWRRDVGGEVVGQNARNANYVVFKSAHKELVGGKKHTLGSSPTLLNKDDFKKAGWKINGIKE